MAKKKKEVKEIIPEGMSRKDYADAAFRKKVTIIMGCILLAFIIAVCGVIFAGWYNREQENKEFDRLMAEFKTEMTETKAELAKIKNFDDKAKVKIELTDDNFHDWIGVLDQSYNHYNPGDKEYASFGGATIHLQGMFVTKEFQGGHTQYWVYRNHSHEDHEHAHEHADGKPNEGEMIPIEVILDENAKIPKDGTWVDVVGIVGPDSTKNLSGVRSAKLTVMEKPGQEYVK